MKHLTMRKVAFVALSALGVVSAHAATTFTNPTFKSQDPWVTYVGGMYYYSGSGCGVADICIKRSRTLTGLSSAPWIGVWKHARDTDPNGRDIWAPELHYVNDRWYIYYAADDSGDNNHHRLFVLSADDKGEALSHFSEADTGLPHGQLAITPARWGIDPNVFIASNGKLYLTWSCTNFVDGTFPQRICLAAMKDALHVASTAVYLSTPDQSWEERGKPIQEGPVGYSRAGRTYITYSGSASFIADDYAVGLLSLDAGADPLHASAWHKSGPIFDHHGKVYGPGSVVFVPSPDGREMWNMYHAIDRLDCKSAYACRDIRMQPMHFDALGAPILGTPVDPGVALPAPSGEDAMSAH
jgi:GH43 family beta-xylosidase